MVVAIAFVSGMLVSVAAVFVPHARNPRTSIEEFTDFQTTLAALPISRAKKPQRAEQ